MAKKIIVTGGGTVSGSRADYIAKSKENDLNQKEKRLFNSLDNDLTREKATDFLGKGKSPNDGELTELIFSLEKKDFSNFGDTLPQQILQMEDAVREGLDNLWKELGVKNVRWAAGIHLNTNNPHAHIVFMRDAQDSDTGELKNVPKIPRDWFRRINGENSRLASFFELPIANRIKSLPPESVITKLPDENIFLPTKEFDTTRIEKNLNRLSEVNHITPNLVEHLTDNRSLYVSRQGALVFLRRNIEGKTTGYVYENGYQPEDKKGFFYIGNPQTATKFIVVENPKEALSTWELTSHRDLSEVCIVASDKNQSPAAFTKYLEQSTNKSIRVIWALGLDREGNQEQTHYEELQQQIINSRQADSPKLEFYSWQPKQGFGRNWSNQLQFGNLPGELNGIIKKISSIENPIEQNLDVNETAEYENKVKETFANVIIEREDEDYVVYQKLNNGKGIEYGRYQALTQLENEEFASPKFSIINNQDNLFDDELTVINEIQQIYSEKIEREFLEAEAQLEKASEILTNDSPDAEKSESVIQPAAVKSLSAKEITERLKDIPLEDVMPRLGLYLTYDKDRREYVYKDDANIHKIKVKGNLWCDRYDDNRGGRNSLNLVMHVEGKSFADARSFLLDNFGTEYIPQETKEKVAIKAQENKPKAPFVMPETNENKIHLVQHYLTEERAISSDIVNKMLDEGFLFANNFGSVGFVNKDENGNVKGASWRATIGTKRGDYTGTEKVNAWFYIGDLKTATRFVVVEAPIEAMSYYQLHQDQIDLSKTSIISTATNSVPMSLVNLLEKNAGENAELVVAYNNDPKGQDGSLYLLEKIGRFGMLKHKSHFENDLIETYQFSGQVTLEIPKLEDWNEDLKAQREVSFYEADNEHIADEIEIESRPELPINETLNENIALEKIVIFAMEGKINDAENNPRVFPVSFDSINDLDNYLNLYKPESGTYKTDLQIQLTDGTNFESTLLVSDKNFSLERLLKENTQNLEQLRTIDSYQSSLEIINAQLGLNRHVSKAIQQIQSKEEKTFAIEENPELLEKEQTADYYEPEKIRSIKISLNNQLNSFGQAEVLLARETSQDKFFHVGYRFIIGGKVYESLPDRNAASFPQGKQSLSVGYGLLRQAITNHWQENGQPSFTEAETLFQPTEDKFLAKVLHKAERLNRDFYGEAFEPSFSIKPELNQQQINALKQWRALTTSGEFYRLENVFAGSSVESRLKRNAFYSLISEGLVETKQDGVFTLVKGHQPLRESSLTLLPNETFGKTLVNDSYVQESAQEYLKIYAEKLKDTSLTQDERDFFGKQYKELKERTDSLPSKSEEDLFIKENSAEAELGQTIILGENPEQDFALLQNNPLKGIYDLKAHRIHQAFQEAYQKDLDNFIGFSFTYQDRIATILNVGENGVLEVNFRAEAAANKGRNSLYTLNQLINDRILNKDDFLSLMQLSKIKNTFSQELENLDLHTRYQAHLIQNLSDSFGFQIKSVHAEDDYVLFIDKNNGQINFNKFEADNAGEKTSNQKEQKEFKTLSEALTHLKEREESIARENSIAKEKVQPNQIQTEIDELEMAVSQGEIQPPSDKQTDHPAAAEPPAQVREEKPLTVAEYFEKAFNNAFKTQNYDFELVIADTRQQGEFDVFYKNDGNTSEPKYRIYAPTREFDEWTILKNNYDPVKNPKHNDFELTDLSFKTEEKLINHTVKRITKDLALTPNTITPLILPTAQQDSRVEKRISKIIYAHKLADKIANSEEFHAILKNEPYEDLHISMDYGTKILRLTHYYEQNGDLMHDGEMNFRIEKSGKLVLNQTAAGLYGRPSFGYDRAFADIFSKNLLNQGFDKATLILNDSQVEETFFVETEAEILLSEEKENSTIEQPILSEEEKTIFFEEFKFALKDQGIKEIVQTLDGLTPEERTFGKLVSILQYENSAADIRRAGVHNFINIGEEFEPDKIQISLTEKGEILNSYLQTEEVPANFKADENQLELLKQSKSVQTELDQKFAAKGLKNPFLVKIEYGNDFLEIGLRNESKPNEFKGYPDYALWKIDEQNWQIAVGDVTPQTQFEPEFFDWLEPVDKQFPEDLLLDKLFTDELLLKTNLSANRQSGDYRYPLALEVEPPNVKKGTISLANEVRELLHEGKAIGNNIAYNKMAESHFGGSRAAGTFHARDAYDALELGVNLYLLDQGKGFVNRPSSEVLTELNQLLLRLPTQTDRTDEQNLFQQFSTPPTESFAAFSALGLRQDDVLLEPSAGNAGLAIWSKLNGNITHVNEISDRRAGILKIIGFDSISRKDAQFLNDTLDQSIKPTVILMNPPFSSTGGRTRNRTIYGAEHISDALLRLQDGGRLVAIVGEGMGFDKSGFTNWWTEIMSKYNVRANIGVQGEEYSKYGTNFGNQLIVIDKTGTTPGKNLAEQFANVITAHNQSISSLINLVSPLGEERTNQSENQNSTGNIQTGTILEEAEKIKSVQSETLNSVKELEKARWDAIGAVTGSRVERLEERGYRVIYGQVEPKSDLYYEISGILGPGADRFRDKGLTIEKFKFNKVEFAQHISREDLRNNPEKIYLFGDNLKQTGFGGQAKEMRGEPNAFGIPTKKAPSNESWAFFDDKDFESNKEALDKAFAKLAKYPAQTTIVMPKAGLGTGLADLENKAPKTYAYLQEKLESIGVVSTNLPLNKYTQTANQINIYLVEKGRADILTQVAVRTDEERPGISLDVIKIDSVNGSRQIIGSITHGTDQFGFKIGDESGEVYSLEDLGDNLITAVNTYSVQQLSEDFASSEEFHQNFIKDISVAENEIEDDYIYEDQVLYSPPPKSWDEGEVKGTPQANFASDLRTYILNSVNEDEFINKIQNRIDTLEKRSRLEAKEEYESLLSEIVGIDRSKTLVENKELLQKYFEEVKFDINFGEFSQEWQKNYKGFTSAFQELNVENIFIGENFQYDFNKARSFHLSQRLESGDYRNLGVVSFNNGGTFDFYQLKDGVDFDLYYLKHDEHFILHENLDILQVVSKIKEATEKAEAATIHLDKELKSEVFEARTLKFDISKDLIDFHLEEEHTLKTFEGIISSVENAFSIHLARNINYSVKFQTVEGNEVRLLIPINDETTSLIKDGVLKKDTFISTSAYIDPSLLANRIAKNKWIPIADVESLTVMSQSNSQIPPRITEENAQEAIQAIKESAETTVSENRMNEVLFSEDLFDTQESVNQKVSALMDLPYNQRILELNRPVIDLDLFEAKVVEGNGATGYSMGVEMDADWVTSNISNIIINNATSEEEKNIIDQLQDVTDKINVVNQNGEILFTYDPEADLNQVTNDNFLQYSQKQVQEALTARGLSTVRLIETVEEGFDPNNTFSLINQISDYRNEILGVVELDREFYILHLPLNEETNDTKLNFSRIENLTAEDLALGISNILNKNIGQILSKENHSLSDLDYPPVDLKVYQEAQANNPDYYEDEDNFSPEEVRNDYFNETFGLAESVLSLTEKVNANATTQKAVSEKKKNLQQLEIDKGNLSFHVAQTAIFFGQESEAFIRQELAKKDIYLNKDNEVEIFQIGAGHLGSGLTIWNRAEREHNDYKIIAHLGENGSLTIYGNRELPQQVLEKINAWKDSSKENEQNQESIKTIFEKFTDFVETDEKSKADFERVKAKQRSDFFNETEVQEGFNNLADRFARRNKDVKFDNEELYIEFLRSQKITVETTTQSTGIQNERTESNNLGNNNANSSGTRSEQPDLFATAGQSDELNAGDVGGNAHLSDEQRGLAESGHSTQGTQSGLPLSSLESQNEKVSQSKSENGNHRDNSGSSIAGELKFERKTLLLPVTVDLNVNERKTYFKETENLSKIGFETIPLNGGKTIAIKTFPVSIKPNESKELFNDLLKNPEKIAVISQNGFNYQAQIPEVTPEEIESFLGVGKNTAKREKVGDLGVVEYKPAKLTKGMQHPADIVESASMAAVEPPDIKYTPKLDKKIIEEGKLSSLQLETVIYAGQRHEHILPNGMRAGYFIGDGTGVGKGRELAGIALDNWNHDRKRILWLSINYDLVPSTDRDLKDLGAEIPLASLDKHSVKTNLNQAVGDGVLFSSYSTLIGKGKDGSTRLDQIIDWLGEDGIIFFDEGHLAKNAVSMGMSEASQRGEAVVDLQIGEKSNPNWRIVYSSATGATELRNMAYMQRLGLWGEGTGFPGGFIEFHNTIDKGGIGAMEMVSRDMKAAGMLLSRSLSYRGVDYRQVHHELTPEQEEIYNLSSKAWSSVLETFDTALQQTNANSRAKSFAYSRLWASQQMFYRQLMTALKVPSLIQETERIIEDGSEYTDSKTGQTFKVPAQVVIGVIGTGEARTKEQVSKAMQLGLDLDNMDFSPKQILMNVVETGFPTKRYTEQIDPASGKTVKVPVLDENGRHLESQQAVMMRDRLLAELEEKVVLPDNPLDQIINYFGENAVAEMTGRKRRIIINPETGQREYVKRAREGVAMDKASQDEMLAFQAARKSVAIISQSASTGISLHSEVKPLLKQYVVDGRTSQEKADELLRHWNETQDTESTIKLFEQNDVDIFRRVHITLETSWSADTQMQTFGRTHRSNEVLPPEYVLMSTNLGGEKRFLSTIAKRLGSLGALTKGDRDQAGGGNLLEFDFENKYGTEAAKKIVTMLRDDDAKLMTLIPPHIETGEEQSGLKMLYTMGIARKNQGSFEVPEKTIEDLQVSKFLNRVLMLDVKTQNAVFDAFTSEMVKIVQHDKELGLFDEGVKDVEGDNIRFAAEPRVVSTDKATGANTFYYQLNADTPTSPVTLKEISDRNQVIRFGDTVSNEINKGVFYQQTTSKNIIYVEKVSSRVDPATGNMKDYFKFARPSGWQSHLLSADELMQKYTPVLLDQVREFKDEERLKVSDWWTQEVADTPKTQVHKYHIIGGAVLPVWQRLSSSNEAGNQMSLKTVRIETEEGERVVGVQIPSNHINRVLRDLGVQQSYKKPDEIFDAVMETKETIDLVGGIKLKPRFLKQQPVIEIMNLSYYQKNEFENYGAIKEIMNFDAKLFIPSDKEKGVEVLTKILERYPAVDKNPQPNESQTKADAAETDSKPSFVESIKEKIDSLTNGFPEGSLAKASEENSAFGQIAKQFEKQPLSSYWWMLKGEINEQNQVVLNPPAFELVRAAYKHTTGQEIRNFDGLFNDENITDKFFETLDRKVAQGGIYAESIASITKTFAEARDRNNGLLVLLTDKEAAGHEDLHVASHVASLGKSLEDRHARFEELTDHEAYKRAKPVLMKIYNTDNDGILVEEVWNWSASGDAHKLNLSKEEAAEFVKLWFTSFAEKNGTITKERFKEMTEDAKQIRDEAYRLVATDKIQRALSDTQGITEPGRTMGNVSTQSAGVGTGNNQTQSGRLEQSDGQVLYKTDEVKEETNLTKDKVFTEFEKMLKASNLEALLEAADGAIHFETVGAHPAHYEIEIFKDQISFKSFEVQDEKMKLMREDSGILFNRDDKGSFKYAGSINYIQNPDETFDDPKIALFDINSWKSNKIIATKIYLEPELEKSVRDGFQKTIEAELSNQLGEQILNEIKVKDAQSKLEIFNKNRQNEKLSVEVEINGEKRIQSTSLKELELEQIAFAKNEVKDSQKTGILKMTAENENITLEDAEKRIFAKAVKTAQEFQEPWREALELKLEGKQKELTEKIQSAETLQKWSIQEVEAIKWQAGSNGIEIENIEPFIKPETIWAEQINAIKRGDAETFLKLEELHREKQIPRPNDVYSRLQAMELLSSLNAQKESKQYFEWTGEKAEQKYVVELKKEGDELKVDNLKLADVRTRHQELVEAHNEARQNAQNERQQATRSALQPLMNKINPFSPVQGTLAWFTSPKATLNAHLNPLEVIKNDPAVQIVRAVYNYIEHSSNAQALEAAAEQAAEQSRLLKEQIAPKSVKNAENLAQMVKEAVGNEAVLRTSLKENPLTNADLLKTPERSFTNEEVKEIGKLAQEINNQELVEKYVKVLENNTELAAEESGAKALAKSLLSDAEAVNLSNQAIEKITFKGETVEVEINAEAFAEAAEKLKTNEVINEFRQTATAANGQVPPRLSLEEATDFDEMIEPLQNQTWQNFSDSQMNGYAQEAANKMMETQLNEADQRIIQEMKFSDELQQRFTEIQRSEMTADQLYQQAQTAIDGQIPFQNVGQNLTVSNPAESLEIEAREFWKNDRLQRESEMSQLDKHHQVQEDVRLENEEIELLEETQEIEQAELAEELLIMGG